MKRTETNGIIISFGIGLCLIVGSSLAYAIANSERMDLLSFSYLGTVVAAIASLIGVFLLYLTYQSQKRELQATQEALRQQKVDTAFFNMLSLLQEIIRSMSDFFPMSKGGKEKVEGRAYLRKALEQLHGVDIGKAHINMRPNPNTGEFHFFNPSMVTTFDEPQEEAEYPEFVNHSNSVPYNVLIDEVAMIYEKFYYDHQQNLGHYFRYVYNIIKYVIDPSNGLKEPDIKRYLGILQSQLSNDEMGLIFYNVLSKHGRTSKGEYRFLKWLDEYDLLENMDQQSLKHKWHHWFFPKTMFKFLDEVELGRKIVYKKTNFSKTQNQ